MNEQSITRKTYLIVWAALMALLVATAAADKVNLGVFNTVIAIGIAFIKAILILLYFMHVRTSSKLTWVFAGAGFLWLVIMLWLTSTDYVTRGWLPVPGK